MPGLSGYPLLNLSDFIVGKYPWRNVGSNFFHGNTVHSSDCADLLHGFQTDKVTNGNQATISHHSQFFERLNSPIICGVANPDIDSIICSVRPVLADFDAVGHELHGHSHLTDVSPVHGCFGFIDVQAEFDTWQVS